jgi:hypothetical protein
MTFICLHGFLEKVCHLFQNIVITVAPQNDICPHGNTYPINAVAIVRNRITTPTDHVCIKLYDP